MNRPLPKLALVVLIGSATLLFCAAQRGNQAAMLTPAPVASGAAPSLISYTEVSWSSTGSPKTTASISWQTGDVVVVIAGVEGPSSTIGTPTTTGSGLTFVSQKNNNAAGTCATRLSAGVATGNSSGTVSVTQSNGGFIWGFGVWVWRGSQGIGNSSEQHTATKTVALTPAAGAHAAVVWAVFDYAAVAVTGISATPPPSHERQKVLIGTNYTIYVEDLTDQSSAGAVSYGITGGSGTGPFSIVALEIKAGL